MERKINVWLPLMLHFLGTWPETQACALTRNQTGDPLVCRPVLNPLNHTSQGKKILHRSIKKVNEEGKRTIILLNISYSSKSLRDSN